jgi:hypothetical protein
MALSHGAKAQDEAHPACGCPALVRMRNDAGIEQGRRFEGVLVQKVGSHEPALFPGEGRVRGERVLHLLGAHFELLEQVAVPALEVFQHFGELDVRSPRVQREHPIDDAIRPRFVRRIQVSRFRGRLEGAHDYACRVGPEMKGLPVQERSV